MSRPPLTAGSSADSSAAPDRPGAASALAAFPALAQLLGAELFGRLAAAAVERADAQHSQPGAVVHSLLLQRDFPRPPHVPGRLAADVAALERAIEEVARLAPLCRDEPRLDEHALLALSPADAERAVLVPLRAFRLVPVAFRLESYVRRLHRGGRTPPPPQRDEQHVVVYALPGRGEIPPAAWWQGLRPSDGRLLAALALGTPLGLAANEPPARELVTNWLRDGLFTSLHLEG